jgi:HK97 gp10 family phage protein
MADSLKLTLGFRDARAIVANFYAADQRAQRELRVAVKSAGDFFHDLAYFLAPVDTSFMRDHLTTVFSDDGLVFEGGYRDSDFSAAGLPFYPPFVEDGTRLAPAQPHLRPAFEETVREFGRDVGAALRRAIARR